MTTVAPGRQRLKVVCPHDCPDTCVMTVDVEDGRAVGLGGDPDHRFTQGFLCAKVNHYLERVYSPDRILYPMKRVGAKGAGLFERVTWDEALDTIAARFRTIGGFIRDDGYGGAVTGRTELPTPLDPTAKPREARIGRRKVANASGGSAVVARRQGWSIGIDARDGAGVCINQAALA